MGKDRKKSARDKRAVPFGREFRQYLVSYLLDRAGDALDTLIVSWLVYRLSGSAALSALAVGVNYLPSIFLQPLAGAWVERRSKKAVLIGMNLGRCSLALLTLFLYTAGALPAQLLVALTFCVSVLEAFRWPATGSLLPALLAREEYDRGVACQQAGGRIAELAGAGLSGIVIARAGIGAALLLDGLAFLGSAALLAPMRLDGRESVREADGEGKRTPGPGEGKRTPGFGELLAEGLRFLRSSDSLLLLVFLCALLNAALTPLNALQAALVQEVYHEGSETLSLLSGTLSAGMLAGAALSPALGKKISVDRALLGCGILNGGFYVAMAALRGLAGSAALYPAVGTASALFGLSVGFLNASLAVRLMRLVPAELMARMTGLLNAASIAAMPLTSFAVAAGAKKLSVTALFTLTGVLLMLVMTVLYAFGCLRRLRE
ncbi:MAG: MFS transporter [Eubacteriales bacterium]|nr:MFS transporter [Eubacteriales bacterium]